ncbi:MAG: SpoIID/LytB domain-containing protein [Cyanobium sp.]
MRSGASRLSSALPAVCSLLVLCISCRAAPLPGASQPIQQESGSQSASAAPAPTPPPQLHWPVPAPAPLNSADPVLLVGLAARLGPAPDMKAAGAAPLKLVAASGTLTLIDADGQRLQAPRLTLHWRRQPLPAPLEIRRRVIAPLASFESAEEVVRSWRSQGVDVAIARAADWEVWAPPEAADPPGRTSRLLERRETSRLVLELQQKGGTRVLNGPMRLEAPGGLVWRQGFYSGPFLLQPDAQGTWSLVEQVPLERYLEGVVPHEIGAGSPPAALTAQAVLARTWALRNRHRFRVDGYHLCADTQCQVYSDPRLAGSTVRQAIAASRLQVLASGGEPIHAVYHATNGGVAAGYEEVWQGAPLPYLRAFPDGPPAFAAAHPLPLSNAALPSLLGGGAPSGWGAYHPLYRWQRTLTASSLSAALGTGAAAVGTPTGLQVLQRGPSGRVLALEIRGTAGRRVLRLDAIRRTLRQLPSTLFTLAPSGPGRWLVQGGGFGHGAGLSQAGAIELAGRGWSSGRILQHYYPGTTLVPLRSLGEAL